MMNVISKSKGVILKSWPFYKIVFSILRSAHDTALDQGFQGLGPVVPHANPEILLLRIGEFSSRAGIKGLSSLKVLDDERCGAPYSMGNPDSGEDKNYYKKKNPYDNLNKFRHAPYSL